MDTQGSFSTIVQNKKEIDKFKFFTTNGMVGEVKYIYLNPNSSEEPKWSFGGKLTKSTGEIIEVKGSNRSRVYICKINNILFKPCAKNTKSINTDFSRKFKYYD